ncbi:reverse transcriptase domain-containing protein [Tanacetum coccineum]
MRTRSSFNLVGNSSSNPTTTNPKHRNRRRSKQPFSLEESPIATMADQRTMAELLRAPTEGYAEAIVVPPILAEHFELKHSLINMMTSDQFFGLEKDNPHDHIRWFNKITSTIKYKDVPNSTIKLMLFPFSLARAARRWLEKEPPRSILTWEDLVSKIINEFFPPSRTTNLRNEISNFEQRFGESFHEAWDRYKDLLRACPHHGFTKLHQLDTFYNSLNPTDQDSLNSAAGGNLLERSTRDVLTIIENKSKVRNSRNKSIVSQVKSSDVNSSSPSEIAKLTHAVNQQKSVVTTAMTAILKQFQATPPPASIKAIGEICVTCGGAHPYYQCLAVDGNTFLEYRDNIQGYVAAATGNYNQGNSGYRPPGVVNQTRAPGFVQQNGQNNQNRFKAKLKIKRGNNFQSKFNLSAPIQQNQSVPLNELEKIKKMNDVNIKAMQAQINNVKNEFRNEMQSSIQASMSNQTTSIDIMASELKAITTRSGLVLDGPTVPMPPPFINPEEDERVEENLTDPKHGEFTIKVPPPHVQKAKPPSQRNFVIHQRDPRHPYIPYPLRMNQEKRQEKDEVQIHKFWKMFKQLHTNIYLVDALILIPKYQKMLKSLLSNKEKLIELANTPLNENCSAVILKKLPEKLGDPGKFLIPCGFSELKCKALAMTRIARDVVVPLFNPTSSRINQHDFVPVRKFTFPADFVIVDYESDPRVPLILGRLFLWTARALIGVHGEEMILHDGDERLILNMRHDTSSYSNQPYKESINMIDIYNVSHEEILEDLFATNHLSGNPTLILEPVTKSSSSPTITSFEESELIWEEFEAYLASDSFPPGNDDPVDLLLEEFADELALITFPSGNDDLPFDIESDDYDDDLFDLETVNDNTYYDPFDSISSDFLPFPECDSVFYEDFSEVDALPSTNNEDKVFNPGIHIHENHFDVTNCATSNKNVNEISFASLILEDFNPPLYELPFHKEVPGLRALLSFSSKNEEKVFNPEILTSKGVHTSLLPELSHRGSKAFKVIKIFESPMEIFPCSYGEDIRVLDVPCLHFYPP